MKLLGLLIVVLGWLIAIGGVVAVSSTTARFVICLIGIVVSLVGILKVLNGEYLKQAIWKQ